MAKDDKCQMNLIDINKYTGPPKWGEGGQLGQFAPGFLGTPKYLKEYNITLFNFLGGGG